jgi:hypothetical protein
MTVAARPGTRRFLLKDEVGSEQVRQVAAQHWFLWDRRESVEDLSIEYVWATKPKECLIRYREDPRVALRYLVLEGPKLFDAFPVIAQRLPVVDRFEILALCNGARTPDAAVRAARKLGVFANADFDAELFGCFGDLSEHRSVEARLASIVAMEYAGWKQFAGLLEPMIADDPNPEVSAQASALLAKL